jgi:hypothetical protein
LEAIVHYPLLFAEFFQLGIDSANQLIGFLAMLFGLAILEIVFFLARSKSGDGGQAVAERGRKPIDAANFAFGGSSPTRGRGRFLRRGRRVKGIPFRLLFRIRNVPLANDILLDARTK